MTPCKSLTHFIISDFQLTVKVRGEAGVCAFDDALRLGRTIVKIRDQQATGKEYEALMTEFRDDMLARGKWAIKVSNPVLEDYRKYTTNYKFHTFGKEAVPFEAIPLAEKEVLAH